MVRSVHYNIMWCNRSGANCPWWDQSRYRSDDMSHEGYRQVRAQLVTGEPKSRLGPHLRIDHGSSGGVVHSAGFRQTLGNLENESGQEKSCNMKNWQKVMEFCAQS